MSEQSGMLCDGCDQVAAAEHVARRLQRLEWATRYRPVHIQTLFLGAFSPQEDHNYLYCPTEEFGGEAAQLLSAVGIATTEKSKDAVQSEFQRAGYFLTYVVECPLEDQPKNEIAGGGHLEKCLRAMASRIRKSLKPRRVILVTNAIRPVVQNILALDLGCPVVLDEGKPFDLSASHEDSGPSHLADKLAWI